MDKMAKQRPHLQIQMTSQSLQQSILMMMMMSYLKERIQMKI